MQNKKVSIIIPCYNVEKFIAQTLESAIAQTLEDIEIIVINDGSSDRTLDIINQYAAIDKRIKIINQKNKGLSAARNIGIKLAKGEYIQHLDGDDFLKLDTCKKTYELAKKNNADIVYFNILRLRKNKIFELDVISDLKEKKIYNNLEIFKKLDKKQLDINIVSKLIKRQLYVKNNIVHYEKISLGEDLFAFQELLLKSKRNIKLNEGLYYYRENPNSITNNKRSLKSNDIFQGYLLFEKSNNFKDEYIEQIKKIKALHISSFLYNKPLTKEKKYIEGFNNFQNYLKKELEYKILFKLTLSRSLLYFIAKNLYFKNLILIFINFNYKIKSLFRRKK